MLQIFYNICYTFEILCVDDHGWEVCCGDMESTEECHSRDPKEK